MLIYVLLYVVGKGFCGDLEVLLDDVVGQGDKESTRLIMVKVC
jgi:hypothetical protein